MAFKFILIILATLLCFKSITHAFAEDKELTAPKIIPDAEELIKHCWDISLEKRSTPNTAIMREGNLDTALCLEDEIITHASALIEETSKTKEEIADLMEKLRFSYGRLYWDMYNNNRSCNPFCGTENHIRHNWELAKLYEKILTDVIALRIEHGV